MKLINLTPHPVKILTDEGGYEIPQSGDVASVETQYENSSRVITLEGHRIHIHTVKKNIIKGLPNPKFGVYYIVSSIVAYHARRKDVLCPRNLLRDDYGKVIGSEGLLSVKSQEYSEKRLDLDIEEIKRLYYDEKKSLVAIGEILGCCDEVVRERMEEHGLKRRSNTASRNRKSLPLDVSEIVRLYTEELLPLTQIGERFDVGYTTIRDRLVKAGVQLRTKKDAQRLRHRSKSSQEKDEQSAQFQIQEKTEQWDERRVSKDDAKSLDLSSILEGTLADKILFMRDTQKAKVQDIIKTLGVSPAEVYNVIQGGTQS